MLGALSFCAMTVTSNRRFSSSAGMKMRVFGIGSRGEVDFSTRKSPLKSAPLAVNAIGFEEILDGGLKSWVGRMLTSRRDSSALEDFDSLGAIGCPLPGPTVIGAEAEARFPGGAAACA